MTALRILNIVIWGAMAAYMMTGAWSAIRRTHVRRGDPMRLACLATALVMIGFNVRWLLIPENVLVWQGLYVLSAGVGCYIIALARAYGRGPRV